MTTSTQNGDDPTRGGVQVEPWEDDTLGDTYVEREGDGSRFYYRVCDMSFEEAYIESDTSKNLRKMR